jgi:rRNA maturation endonuclease Nob1
MAGSQGMKKKEDIASIINSILDEATRTRKGFTPEVVREFESEGRRASQGREERRAEPRAREEHVREMTPSRQLGSVVAHRAEDTERKASISPVMTQRAIECSVDLGERLELAASGRRTRGEWASG